MKTLLLAAAAAVSLGFGVARAETPTDSMHSTMVQHETMRAGDRTPAQDAAMKKQAEDEYRKSWQQPIYGGGNG